LKFSEPLAAMLPRIAGELEGLDFGIVHVELHVRDGHLSRAVIGREESIVLEEGRPKEKENGNH
jgi:hypothetical protein